MPGGQVDLLHQNWHRHLGEQRGVDQEHHGGERQRPANDAARALQHDQDRDHGENLVRHGQLVDVDDAVGEGLVVDEDVEDEGEA
jgi:hypothetical protein